MEKVRDARRITSIILIFVMAFVMLFGTSATTFASSKKPITMKFGTTEFTKISNPTNGPMDPDGINTNDETGFDANRLNSYAWAVVSRGDYIYVGTNRTLFGSALNATAELIKQGNPDIDPNVFGKIVNIISGGQVPVLLSDEDYIPQIIRFSVKDGSSRVLYRPETKRGDDGRLYYTDKNGNIVSAADVASETLSFRSAIDLKGNLYFGTLGANMLRIVRIDENDNADIPFETIGSYSSLRACCLHEIEENTDTIFFGGQDATNMKWRRYIGSHPDQPRPLPIVIRYLEPGSAGGENENWDGLVADFQDFGKYAYASVYVSGGGNVWDLCSYKGKLYLILAYDGGWAMFRGEKGGDKPNEYGWTWTEIVGDGGRYPLAMDEEVGKLNAKYKAAYGCSRYSAALNGSGILESTATPYVYKDKMYIGSFDNATALQAQTTIKLVVKLMALKKAKETGIYGPTLEQIFAPFYEALSHPQHVWVMDEDENIEPVESANDLLDGTTNDYVWRFIEYKDKLYTGTFDSATAYNYFLDFTMDRFISALKENKDSLPDHLKQLLDGEFTGMLMTALGSSASRMSLNADDDAKEALDGLQDAAVKASADAEAFLAGDKDIDELLASMTALEDAEDDLQAASKPSGLALNSEDDSKLSALDGDAGEMIEFLKNIFDVEGLKYWAKARKLIRKERAGFDLFVTEDGEDWEKITDNGLRDRFNYGARTFTICNDELYLGTANPYYGAQLWKVTPGEKEPPRVVVKPKAAALIYNGELQKLVRPGVAKGGTILYARGLKDSDIPDDSDEIWSEEISTEVNAGDYVVFWKVEGDKDHSSMFGGAIDVSLHKAHTNITVEQPSAAVKQKSLKTKKWSFNINASASSGADLKYMVTTYKNKASRKYLKFDAKKGEVTVKKGTPKGDYGISVILTAGTTDNYYSGYKYQPITVTVRA